MAGCGLRVSEVAAIKVEHLDGPGGYLHVVDGKGGKQRTSILPEPVIEALQGHPIEAGHTVAGRTATIYTMLWTAWKLLETSPFGDVFIEAEEDFKGALDDLAAYQGTATKEETEVARFMAGINELMAGNPGLFLNDNGVRNSTWGKAIGRIMPDGVWLMPIETLNELSRIKTFTQLPNEDSMTMALDREGLLIHSSDGRKKYQISMNCAKVRGWYVKLDRTHENEGGNPPVVTANR